jgi:hypothetical protein
VKPTIRFDGKNFGDMVADIVRRTGKTQQQIVDEEATHVLRTCIRKSDMAQAQDIRKRHNEREWANYRGKLYRIAGQGKYGNQKKPHGNRYPDMIWAGIMSLRNRSLAEKLARRGLLKGSWWLVARRLNLNVDVPQAALRSLRNLKGKIADGIRQLSRGSGTYEVFMGNYLIVAARRNGQWLINSIMKGRVRQYRRAVEEGFKKLARTSGATKGVTVT